MLSYFFLLLTICAEVVGAVASRYSDGFRRRFPTLMTILAITISYYCFALSLKHGIMVGIGYAIWSGVGVIAVTLISFLVFRETIGVIQRWGIALIIAGVMFLELG